MSQKQAVLSTMIQAGFSPDLTEFDWESTQFKVIFTLDIYEDLGWKPRTENVPVLIENSPESLKFYLESLKNGEKCQNPDDYNSPEHENWREFVSRHIYLADWENAAILNGFTFFLVDKRENAIKIDHFQPEIIEF